MSMQYLKFNKVSFGYNNSVNNILELVSFQISNGWTGVLGNNGAGKTTLLKLACGLLKCSGGSIERPLNLFYNEQRTDYAPANLNELLNSYEKHSIRLINELDIKEEWYQRWKTLSHGERKRAQIACAVNAKPELIAVDEPTNHLDANAKEMIVASLKLFNGIGLIVSHDRELLENICTQFLFIERQDAKLMRGKLSDVLKQREQENEHVIRQMIIKKGEINKLEKEYNRRKEIVDKSQNRLSKKNYDKKDRDGKGKIDLARLTGKDAVGGRLKSLMLTRVENAKEELFNIEVKREYKTGILLSGSYSKRNYLLNVDGNALHLSNEKILKYNGIFMTAKDRIALTGENGSGKSSLLCHLLQHINADSKNIIYVPQEISLEETKILMNEIHSLKNEQLGKLLIIMSRLGSDAKRILDTETPSPGETRKLLLGLGITKEPHIIIMDEPTNHMDLTSIECLENALQNVSCALLLVSHDKKFLEKVTEKEWKIVKKEDSLELIVQ